MLRDAVGTGDCCSFHRDFQAQRWRGAWALQGALWFAVEPGLENWGTPWVAGQKNLGSPFQGRQGLKQALQVV